MTDELLVVRAQLGERDAFAGLVRAWHEPVHAFVRRMIGPGDADDVAQEVWLAVVRGLPRLREPARFAPWLFRIARRAVVNRLRAEYARPPVSAPGAVEFADAAIDRAVVAEGLAGVPAPERELLILFYLQDLSLETCAEICGVPVGTVKSRLSRGRRLLRESLARKGHLA